MATIDWTDPCARLAALQAAYYELVGGEREASYSYQAEGVLRSVTWQKVDMSRLQGEIRAAEIACAAATGAPAPARRRAITAGLRRTPW